MSGFSIPISTVILVLIFTSAFICAIVYGRKRCRELSAMADRLEFDFNPDNDYALAEKWGFLPGLEEGEDRYAYNILKGECDGYRVSAFDYHSRTGSGKNADHHFRTVFVMDLPCVLPTLSIRPEGLFSKVAQAVGDDDIDFESAEFSRTFDVRSKDKRFAYDVCNPQMMEFLLENRKQNIEIKKGDWLVWKLYSIEVRNNALALVFYNQLPVREFEFNLVRLVQIRSHLPDYLFTKA